MRSPVSRVQVNFGTLAAVGLMAAAITSPAKADAIYDSTINIQAQGFGHVPRILTLQTTGTESGCVAATGGSSFSTGSGSCITDASLSPNGVTNAGGNEVLGANKTGIATLSTYNLSNASNLSIVYNPSQTGANPETTITDLTLKFYDAAGNLVISADTAAPINFDVVNPGNGGAGFALVLDSAQAAAVNAAFGGNISSAILSVEATITGSNDGPDTFTLVNLAAPPPPITQAPEPASLALLGGALLGFGMLRRRKRA